MNYTTLVADASTVGSVKYWLNWSRIDADGILDEAEAWIYQRLRVPQMTAFADIAIASGASVATLPDGYLDPLHLGIPGYVHTLSFRDAEAFRGGLGWDTLADLPSAPPTKWTDLNNAIQLNSKADQAYTAKLTFYKLPAALDTSNETNFLTDRYPSLLRRVCVMFGAESRKEYDLMDRNELKALAAIEDIKRESDMRMRGMESDFNWEATQ